MRRFIRWAILALIVLAAAAAVVVWFRGRDAQPSVSTIAVTRRDLVREITVTATVKPVSEVALAFERSGRIAQVLAAVGDTVASGLLLATLDNADLRATLAQRRAAIAVATADLAELRRGPRVEEVRVAEADVESAQRAHADAQRQLANIRAQAQSDLDGRYADIPNTVRDAFTKTDDAVRKRTDELFTNDATAPKLAFQTTEFQAAIDAEQLRRRSEEELNAWARELVDVAVESPRESPALRQALRTAATHLEVVRQFLDRTMTVTLAAQHLAQATIDTYTTSLGVARTNVNTARTAVDALEQAIAAQEVANRKVVDVAAAEVNAKHSARTTAEARLQRTRAGATAEQLAAAEARRDEAVASAAVIEAELRKFALHAPFDGVVTRQEAKVGAIASPGVALTTLVSTGPHRIEANIPEVDIADLTVGQAARVTLDAYGDEVVFAATVTTIDPAATLIDGVPTYRATLAFRERDPRIRPGMTANVTIATGRREGVLAVPQRTVIDRNGRAVVRVLRGGTATDEAVVRTGLRSSDGFVEILEGLREGDLIVRSAEPA